MVRIIKKLKSLSEKYKSQSKINEKESVAVKSEERVMEGGNGNRSSSFSLSRRGRGRGRGRGHRFPSNQSKVSSFGERGTSSSSSGSTASSSVLSNRQEEDAQPSSNIVGTCPYMCPGEHIIIIMMYLMYESEMNFMVA